MTSSSIGPLPGAPADEVAGPIRGGDLAVEWRGIHPVPVAERYGRPRDMIWFWFALQLFPVAFFIGALGDESFIGLSFGLGVAAIIVGNLIAAIAVAAMGTMGPRTGLAQLPLARAPFGRTVSVPSVLAYLVSLVFLASGAVYGSEALEVIFGLPFLPAIMIVFACEGIISIVGYELLHRYANVTAALAGAGFLAVGIVVVTKADQVAVHQTVHGGAVLASFVAFAAIALSFSFGWCPNASDFCRYLPEDVNLRRLFWSTYSGLALGCILIEVLGLAAASLLKDEGPMRGIFDLLSGGGLGYLVMIVLAVGVVANIAATDYSAGLQLLSGGVTIPRPIITGLSVLIAFSITLWLHGGNLIEKASDLILIATYWIGPYVAITAIHWWRFTPRDHVEAALVPIRTLPSGRAALIALVVGFVVCLPFSSTVEGSELAAHGGVLKLLFGSVSTDSLGGADLAYPVGLAVGGLLYWWLGSRSRGAAPGVAADGEASASKAIA